MPLTAPSLLSSPPAADEFIAYYQKYIDKVPAGNVLETLEAQLPETVALLDRFGEARGGHRYAPGKWSVKEVVGHLADSERVFVYRAMCAARSESGALPAFDENAYVANAGFDGRTLNSLLGEYTAVRRATLSLFRNLTEEQLARRVVANGNPISARAIAWIVAGHERHHAGLLAERYL